MTGEKTKEIALPTSFEEIRGFAQAFKESGMFSDTKSVAQAIVKITAGAELGLPAVYAMQNINMIRDRLTTSANTMAMLVKRSGRYNYRIKEHTDQVCSITFFEDGREEGVSTFTMEDAKRANLVKPDSGWIKFPRAMLFSRAISQGARIYCPDAIGGIYTDEEIRSIPSRPEDSSPGEKPVRTVEQVAREMPEATTSTPSASTAEGIEEQSPIIDLVWLRESLNKIKWSEKTATSYIAAQIVRDEVKGSLSEVLAGLASEDAKKFVVKIQSLLELV